LVTKFNTPKAMLWARMRCGELGKTPPELLNFITVFDGSLPSKGIEPMFMPEFIPSRIGFSFLLPPS
jgi:hypothetical protein